MKILLLSATQGEIAPLMPQLESWPGKHVDTLISGIGSVATAYQLTRTLNLQRYDLVIHAGIAGCFSDAYLSGSVVQIGEDVFGSLGVEDRDAFHSAHAMGFSGGFPYTDGILVNPTPPLPDMDSVRGVTVDTVSGNGNTIRRLCAQFHPTVETMESAACFYVCLSQKQTFCSIRAISNKVAPRNKSEWKVEQAIESLNSALYTVFSGL